MISAPYVSIQSKNGEKLEIELKELQNNWQNAHKLNAKKALETAYREFDKFMFNTYFPYYDSLTRLIDLMTTFYENRHVPYDVALVISGSTQDITIRNVGFINEYFTNKTLNREKLKEYQEEFIAFGDFLKKRYFSDGVDITSILP